MVQRAQKDFQPLQKLHAYLYNYRMHCAILVCKSPSEKPSQAEHILTDTHCYTLAECDNAGATTAEF